MRRAGFIALTLGLFLAPAGAQEVGFLDGTLQDLLTAEGRTVQVVGFQGALSSTASLEELTIADNDGVWLTVRGAELSWNRLALLRGRIEVDHLRAKEIIVARTPSGTSSAPSAEASGFSLPDLPVSIEIGDLSADRLSIGSPVFGLAVDLGLSGQLSLSGGAGNGRINATRLDGPKGVFDISGAFDNASGILSLSAVVEEAPQGIVVTLANVPGLPSIALNAEGEGPLSKFDATLNLATDGADRLSGSFGLREDDAGMALFEADVSGDIAPLFLPEFEDFFGRDIRLVLQGRSAPDGALTLDPFSLDTAQLKLGGKLSLGPDGLPDVIDVRGKIASRDGAPVRLPVSGTYTELAQAEITAAFDAAVSDSWRLQLGADRVRQPGLSVDRIEANGTGRISDIGGKSVTADVTVEARALDLGDAGAKRALGESVRADVSIGWRQGAPVRLDRLDIAGESYRAEGEAVISASGGAIDIETTATVQADDLSVFSGVAGRALAGSIDTKVSGSLSPIAGFIDMTASGTGRDLRVGIPEVDRLIAGDAALDLRLRRNSSGTFVDGLRADTGPVRIAADAALRNDGGKVTLSVDVASADLAIPGYSGALSLRANADGASDVWTIDATLDGDELGAKADLQADLSGTTPAISGRVDARLSRLQPVGDLLGRPLGGSAAVKASGNGVIDFSRFDIELTADTTDLLTGVAQLDPLLQGAGALSLKASRSGGPVEIGQLDVSSPWVEARLSGQAGLDGTADLKANFTLPVPARIAPGLPGPLSGTVALAGGPDAWRTVTDISGPGTVVDADLSVDLAEGARRAEGSARIRSDDLAPFSDLAGRVLGGSADLSAKGSGRLDLSEFSLDLNGEVADPVTGIAQADALLAGLTRLDLSVSRTGDTITAKRLMADNPGFALDGAGSLSLSREGQARVDLTLREPGRIAPGLPGPVTVTAGATGGPDAWDVTADIGGTGLGASVKGVVDLSQPSPEFDGSVKVTAEDLSPFSQLARRSIGGSLSIDAKGRINRDATSFDLGGQVTGQNLRSGIAAVDDLLRGTLSASGQAQREGKAIRIENVQVFTPQISATGTGRIGQERSTAEFDVTLANLALFVPGLNGPLSASGRAAQNPDGEWRIGVNADGPGGIEARVRGGASPDLSTVDLTATGRAPLSAANRFIEPRAIDGTAQFDLAIKGPPRLSSVTGRIAANDARLVAPNLGIVLERVRARADLAGARATIDASAGFQAGGGLSAAGTIGLQGGFPADLRISLQDGVIEDPTLYQTTVGGDIAINGALRGGARISGGLMIGTTEVQIPSTGVSGAFSIPDIVHLNEPASVRATRQRAGLIRIERAARGASGPAYPLDILVEAPNRIFVRGRGLDSELGGSIRIAGTTAAPIPSGQFELLRGRLDILGQRLVLSEGFITVQGNFDPVVRLVATTQKDDTVISIVVSGPVSNPKIQFLSEPQLPEDEVVARLLFGRGIESLSPLQAARLAAAVATLAGRGGGLLSKVREGFGLSDLDVTTREDGTLGVRAGAYVSENVYTDVTVGSDGQAKVSINLDLSPSVKLKGSADSAGKTGVGVFFERDY